MTVYRNGRGVDGTEASQSERAIRVMAGGHREEGLRAADREALARRIGHTLDLIASRSRGTPRLIVSLAEGADRLIVDEALARGWPVTAVLPFVQDEFEHDFDTAASRQEYREMLARAAHVIEVPGVRGVDAGDGAAYAAANQVMLDQADLVLSVWDGKPARGPGGTAEVIAQGRSRGLPVIWIAERPPHAIRLLDPEGAREPAPWWDRLAADLAQPTASSNAG